MLDHLDAVLTSHGMAAAAMVACCGPGGGAASCPGGGGGGAANSSWSMFHKMFKPKRLEAAVLRVLVLAPKGAIADEPNDNQEDRGDRVEQATDPLEPGADDLVWRAAFRFLEARN